MPLHFICIYISLLFAEIPNWLDVYYKASPEHDHKLKWDLFRLPELDAFQAMLTRLYKEDLRTVVMDYEAYRQSLLREIERRHVRQLHIQVQYSIEMCEVTLSL